MKMVKSLLLGSAAGLVAVAGAQAADLPVKAKPVEYVKICSLYGAGFYYIPGTDTCLKIGGWVRQYLGVNSNNNLTNGRLGSGNINTRSSNNGWAWKARGYITADARTQTEFGTLRSYIAVGGNTQGQSGNSVFNSNRAFIQLAGFTFGVAQSFYDLYPTPALSYFGGMINPSSDTGDGGETVTAYTAQFGNGFSSTLALEAPRTIAVLGPNSTFGTGGTGAYTAVNTAAVRYPDIVANLRWDSTWGAAQIMGGIHDVAGTYYGATTSTTCSAVQANNNTCSGGPGYATGYFIGTGAKINFPSIGPGDYFSFQVNYTVGAAGYAVDAATNGGTIATGGPGGFYSNLTSSSFGLGLVSDGVYSNGTAAGTSSSISLTTTWGVNAAYEHYWSKRWQTSIYGAYLSTSYNSTANAQLCIAQGAAGAAGQVFNAATAVTGSCNNNWQYWDVGTRTQFNVDSQTYIGLDVIYTNLKSANGGMSGNSGGLGHAADPTSLDLRSERVDRGVPLPSQLLSLIV